MRTNNTKQFSEKSSIFYWMDKLIYYKRQSGKDSTADLYRATRNWLYRFIHRRNLSVFQITSSLIDNFVNYLKRLGIQSILTSVVFEQCIIRLFVK